MNLHRWAWVIVVVACGSGEVHLGDQFTLRMGASASIPDLNLSVSFTNVTADSRCPAGAECIVAGDASVVLQVAPLTGDAKLDTLHTNSDPQTTPLARAQLRLLRLDPYPRVGSSIAHGDYVVTLVTEAAS